MSKPITPSNGIQKVASLRAEHCLHPHPERVRACLFQHNVFFDARDALQVKYEMLRQPRVDGAEITSAAVQQGYSRVTWHQCKLRYEVQGIQGLVPRLRGPREGHKLDHELTALLVARKAASPGETSAMLAAWLLGLHGIRMHARSIRRCLQTCRPKKTLGSGKPAQLGRRPATSNFGNRRLMLV